MSPGRMIVGTLMTAPEALAAASASSVPNMRRRQWIIRLGVFIEKNSLVDVDRTVPTIARQREPHPQKK